MDESQLNRVVLIAGIKCPCPTGNYIIKRPHGTFRYAAFMNPKFDGFSALEHVTLDPDDILICSFAKTGKFAFYLIVLYIHLRGWGAFCAQDHLCCERDRLPAYLPTGLPALWALPSGLWVGHLLCGRTWLCCGRGHLCRVWDDLFCGLDNLPFAIYIMMKSRASVVFPLACNFSANYGCKNLGFCSVSITILCWPHPIISIHVLHNLNVVVIVTPCIILYQVHISALTYWQC